MKEVATLNTSNKPNPLKQYSSVLVVFALSRLFFALMIFMSGRYSYGQILKLFDAEHYINIARHGYYDSSVTAFFPLIPLLIRYTGIVGTLIINNLCFLGSLLVMDKLTLKEGKRTQAGLLTLAVLAFSPVGFFSMLLYTESVFFFLTIICFYLFTQRRHYILSGILLGLSVCTRNTGSMLFASIFIAECILLYRREIKFSSILKQYIPATLLSLSYPIFLQVKFGNWKIFADIQMEKWVRIRSNVFATIWAGLKVVFTDNVPGDGKMDTIVLFKSNEALTLILMIFCLVLVALEIKKYKKTLSPESVVAILYMLLCIFCFGLTIRDPKIDTPTTSFYRYYYCTFPMYYLFKNLKEKALLAILVGTLLLSMITSMVFSLGVFFF